MLNSKLKKIALITLFSTFVVGCTTSTQPNVYSRSELQSAQNTFYGTIQSVKPIQIEGESNAILNIAGTALGALAGAQVGGGSGKIAGAIVGGLASGYATDAVTQKATKTNGVELTVKLDGGRVLTFAQEGDPNSFQVNQRVKVLIDGHGKARVDYR